MTLGSDDWLTTSVGHATPDAITVGGLDLADDVMGTMSLSGLAYRLVARRSPSDAELRLFDAVLVSLADHGLTPSALAARLTYTGAPEAIQGAVAAGLLGAGTVFLGVVEDTARFLTDILLAVPGAASPPPGAAGTAPGGDDERRPDRYDEADLREAAASAVAARRADGRRVPGLGHPVHRVTDPRTPRLYGLAEELDLLGPHLQLLALVADEQARIGRRLPVNGAGAAGAALADLGFDWRIIRGFALLARTAGLVGHLAEEIDRPLGMPLWQSVDLAARPPEPER